MGRLAVRADREQRRLTRERWVDPGATLFDSPYHIAQPLYIHIRPKPKCSEEPPLLRTLLLCIVPFIIECMVEWRCGSGVRFNLTAMRNNGENGTRASGPRGGTRRRRAAAPGPPAMQAHPERVSGVVRGVRVVPRRPNATTVYIFMRRNRSSSLSAEIFLPFYFVLRFFLERSEF